jgi:hypothetical protein
VFRLLAQGCRCRLRWCLHSCDVCSFASVPGYALRTFLV